MRDLPRLPAADAAATLARQPEAAGHEPAGRAGPAAPGGDAAASRSGPADAAAPPAWVSPVDRVDLSGLTARPPLHRPTVSGAGTEQSGKHVGGAVRPAADHTVALSDGTRISFGSVEEVPVLELA